jgi:hypothetical protein
MTREQWITAFAQQAGVEPPTPKEVDELLQLAATAAHASERTAAPIACWVAGRSQVPLAQLRARALDLQP